MTEEKQQVIDQRSPIRVLQHYFGYSSFRPGQEEIIDNILSGRDALAVMPTGAGKSICYQVPAMLMPGITLVISPLISLMKDQVKALNEAGIHAAFINSSLTERQINKALSLAAQGRFKLIYVAPERLQTASFQQFCLEISNRDASSGMFAAKQTDPYGRLPDGISMVVVDEAHCISQWGQDFRPSYVHITDFIRTLPGRPVVAAFTATATTRVREDIAGTLQLQNPKVVVTGFDRPNLYYRVEGILWPGQMVDTGNWQYA